jgi:RNA polymerase sigma factor (TIGR02999 family)
MEPQGDITALLVKLRVGDRAAEHELVSMVYDELRRLARSYMGRERPDHTLQATALVNEAFLRLTAASGNVEWQNRAHFFAVAANIMRRILVDYARSANAGKRPNRARRATLESALLFNDEQSAELLDLDSALDRLKQWDPRQCRIVELRFFVGLSLEEIAEVLGVSTRTVKRDWTMARAWLHGELNG